MALAMAASGAESDGSDDSERYGGGRGSRDPDRVSTKDLPKWTGKRGDYPEWQWEATPHFEAANLGDTMDGSNMSRLTSSDAKIKAKYKKKKEESSCLLHAVADDLKDDRGRSYAPFDDSR